MRWVPGLFTAILVIGSALDVPANSASPPPPIEEIPFDDDDEMIARGNVARQVLTFLQTVQTHWGQSPEAVRDAVTGDIVRDAHGTLIYTRALAEHGVLEGYEFHEGSLVRGNYRCLQRPINGLNEFIGYYSAVKHALTSSYGAPVQEKTVWENDLYHSLPDYWGVAVMIGHLRYGARWETADGMISIELTGNRYSRLVIDYRGKDFIRNNRAM